MLAAGIVGFGSVLLLKMLTSKFDRVEARRDALVIRIVLSSSVMLESQAVAHARDALTVSPARDDAPINRTVSQRTATPVCLACPHRPPTVNDHIHNDVSGSCPL
jgi:hypothetical protein